MKALNVPILLTFYYPRMFKCFPELQSLVEGQWEELVVGKLKSMKPDTLSVREATDCSLSLDHLVCDIKYCQRSVLTSLLEVL